MWVKVFCLGRVAKLLLDKASVLEYIIRCQTVPVDFPAAKKSRRMPIPEEIGLPPSMPKQLPINQQGGAYQAGPEDGEP